MRAILFAAGLALTASGLVAPASAETLKFAATLTPQDEVPPHPTLAGKGSLTATLDTDTRKLAYHLDYEGLTGKATMAHFHGPAGPGVNAGVLVPVPGVRSAMDGSATLTAEQVKQLEGGQMYFNVHTEANKGGEIRGQVLKAM